MMQATGIFAASTAAGLAQPDKAPTKGPLVWLDMDQAALDDAYTQPKYAPNASLVLRRYGSRSEETRRILGPPERFSYGPSAVEALDVYSTKQDNAPIMVFVHGGAWRGGTAAEQGFLAENFVRAGAHFIALDFTNVIESRGDLMPMIEQVRRAIAWVSNNAGTIGGDRDRIFLSGHSSGGHLAGAALTTDWQKDFGVSPRVIKGAVLVSGLYDLKAPRLSVRSSYVAFTDAIEDALSTQRHLDKVTCPVALINGSLETPEFLRQSREFAAAMKAAGKPVEYMIVPDYNHFEVLETMASPYGFAGRVALRQMGLSFVSSPSSK
jgi:arylformamidase